MLFSCVQDAMVLARLREIEGKYTALEAEMASPLIASSPQEYQRLSRSLSQLEEPVQALRHYQRLESDLRAAKDVVRDSTGV